MDSAKTDSGTSQHHCFTVSRKIHVCSPEGAGGGEGGRGPTEGTRLLLVVRVFSPPVVSSGVAKGLGQCHCCERSGGWDGGGENQVDQVCSVLLGVCLRVCIRGLTHSSRSLASLCRSMTSNPTQQTLHRSTFPSLSSLSPRSQLVLETKTGELFRGGGEGTRRRNRQTEGY